MIRWTVLCAIAMLYFSGAAEVLALPPSAVERAERATALVDVNTSDGRAFGSAFCINDTGLFATDGHVVGPSTGEIKVIIRSGEKDEHATTAHILGIDYDADLALIQADNAPGVPKLPLGNSDGVAATQEITAFGYPFGNMLALDKGAYPSVTVNSGKVTALRKEAGDLRLIQVDALVNPGDSGGPVLDSDGRVVGVVESGVPGAGLNFATPVARLKKMLEGPLVLIEPIHIDYEKRTRQQDFTIHVSSLNSSSHSKLDYAVEFKITDPKGAVQTVSGNTTGGKCDLLIAPTTDNSALKWNPFQEEPPTFKFVLTLKQSGKVVGTDEGTIFITDIPMPGETVRSGPPRKGPRASQKGSPEDRDGTIDALPSNAMDTAMLGAEKGVEFQEVSAKAQLAVGVQYTPSEVDNKPTMTEIKLLFKKPAADPPGDKRQSIVAKDGYVVGGMNVAIGRYSIGQFFNGFQVIFIRQKNGKLDPTDTYTADWAGQTPPGKGKQLAGNGERVIGICGRKGVFIRAIGLVVEKSGDPAATQPVSAK